MAYSYGRTALRRRGMSPVHALAATVLVLACGLRLQAYEAPDEGFRFRAGLHNGRGRPLNTRQLRSLLEGLRFWTGLTGMSFDESGSLDLGDRASVAGGSATARALLAAAVDSPDSFVLEEHSRSPAVAFTQIETTEDYVDSAGARHVVWRLKIDFQDFAHLRGGAQLIAAFDPAVNLLHELGHGVLKKYDAVSREDRLGECERHINRMRVELGLPERQHYHPLGRMAVMPGRTAETLQAELIFVQTVGKTGQRKTLYLTYDAERVSTVNATRPPPGRRVVSQKFSDQSRY